MMSPRSPSSRRTGSALGETCQRPVSISVASPIRSSFRARAINSARSGRKASSVSGSGRRSENSWLFCASRSRTVEPGETVGVHLPLEALGRVLFALTPQLQGDDLAGPLADAMGDIVAGDVEGLAVLGDAAKEDVGVGMAGVVVIDRDPVELGPEIGLHLLHQIAGGLARVGRARPRPRPRR